MSKDNGHRVIVKSKEASKPQELDAWNVPLNIQTCYDGIMSTANTVLDELLEPVGACFTPEVAQRLINLRASSAVQKRIEELARKSEQGQLSKVEQEEYEALVSAGNFIAILQSKARRLIEERLT